MTTDTDEIVDLYIPNMIRKRGIEALTRELGPIGMAHFIRQFDPGEGDYTKEREQLLAGITVDDILRELRK